MAEKHPYSPSASGLIRTVDQLRRTFPPKVDVGALKKLDTAPKNEGQVLQILKFINVLDDNFSKTDIAASVFTMHNDEDFHKGLSSLVKEAYNDIFTLQGNDAWTLPLDKLISYFRTTNQTSEIVGKRQALTFQTLAGLCGYQPEIQVKQNGNKKNQDNKTSSLKQKVREQKTQSGTPSISLPSHGKETNQGFGLTVRIEINLPAVGDQDTYDKIFKSIRENLLNG